MHFHNYDTVSEVARPNVSHLSLDIHQRISSRMEEMPKKVAVNFYLFLSVIVINLIEFDKKRKRALSRTEHLNLNLAPTFVYNII
ncbi:hypothetical protein FQA39_LY12192 [Lamprigera yunnana]|nr:hypothetical protein FQA39_LY12192 [Lamprigera yunnana]